MAVTMCQLGAIVSDFQSYKAGGTGNRSLSPKAVNKRSYCFFQSKI